MIDCLAAEPSVHVCPAPPSEDQDSSDNTRADARDVWHHMLTCSSSGEWKQGGASGFACRANNRAHCVTYHPLQAPRTWLSCCHRYLQPSAVLRVQAPAVPQADLQRGEAGGTHWRISLDTASRRRSVCQLGRPTTGATVRAVTCIMCCATGSAWYGQYWYPRYSCQCWPAAQLTQVSYLKYGLQVTLSAHTRCAPTGALSLPAVPGHLLRHRGALRVLRDH